MPILVQKYGGSSVADVEKIGHVADQVVAAKRAGNDVVVVVSAMGKTTDALLSLARSAANGVAGNTGDPPRRELDMLLSTGERVSMALLSIAVQARGFEAISFTGSQSGIITNDRHFDARIIEVRPHRIEDELARGKIVIVAGYQGMSYRREITTLGRGGSDTTAVALAAALDAERCEIYSDVDGVYSADPRIVEGARHLPELDYGILQEMAESGAKVLNAQAVEWARRAKIAIHARSTFDPSRETVVRRFGERTAAYAVVGEAHAVLGRFDGELSRLLEVAERAELPLRELSFSAHSETTSFVIPRLNVPDWEGARRALEGSLGAALSLDEEAAVVSVIGDGLGSAAALARFVAALSSVTISLLRVTASNLRISAVVELSRLEEAQRALHFAFHA